MSDERSIQTRCGPLHVRDVGSGPVAVLWHSLFVDSASWQQMIPCLGARRRLILIDGPGHGASGDPGKRYTVQDCATAAIEVLDALGIAQPVDWVGNAWGGHVGIAVAAAYPERLRSLATIGTPVAAHTPAEAREMRLLLGVYRLIGPVSFIRSAISGALLAPATRARDPETVAYVDKQVATANRRMFGNAVVSISLDRQDASPILPQITVPTLFITGTDHSAFPPEKARAAIALVPGGRLEVLSDAAYLVPIDQPAETARLLTEFWASLAPQPAGL